jgi:hypothetical protein
MVIFERTFRSIDDGKARATLMFHLSHVWSAWRIAALSSHHLWSTVVLDATRANPYEIVSTTLARVGPNHLLDVYILESPYATPNASIARWALGIVAHRWKSITVASSENAEGVLESIVGHLDGAFLNNLETVCIADIRFSRMLIAAKRRVSHTRPLNKPLETSFLYRNLTSLKIEQGPKAAAQLRSSLEALAIHSPFLSQLAFGTELTMRPYALVVFNHLRALQFPLLCQSDSSAFRHISAPALVQLELGPLSVLGWHIFHTVHDLMREPTFPKVTTLRLFNTRLEADIDKVNSYGTTVGIHRTGTCKCSDRSFLGQTTSIFEHPPYRPDADDDYHEYGSQLQLPYVMPLSGLHAAMPALSSLELDNVPSTRILIWLCNRSGGGSLEGTCHWPELREIALKGSTMRELRGGVLVALVDAREAAGRPVHRIQLKGSWSCGSPTQALRYLRSIVTLEEAEQ